MLIESFLELSSDDNTQIIFTTHSPEIGKMIPIESLRFIYKQDEKSLIDRPSDDIIEKVVKTLGVFPEIELNNIETVKVAICVERKNDIDLNSKEIMILPYMIVIMDQEVLISIKTI